MKQQMKIFSTGMSFDSRVPYFQPVPGFQGHCM